MLQTTISVMQIFKKISHSQISLFVVLYTLVCLLYRGILTRIREEIFLQILQLIFYI